MAALTHALSSAHQMPPAALHCAFERPRRAASGIVAAFPASDPDDAAAQQYTPPGLAGPQLPDGDKVQLPAEQGP
jgi:hypothetical protein